MSKLNFTLEDLKDEEFLDILSEEENYVPTRVIKSESLTMREKDHKLGNKSKSKKARMEVY